MPRAKESMVTQKTIRRPHDVQLAIPQKYTKPSPPTLNHNHWACRCVMHAHGCGSTSVQPPSQYVNGASYGHHDGDHDVPPLLPCTTLGRISRRHLGSRGCLGLTLAEQIPRDHGAYPCHGTCRSTLSDGPPPPSPPPPPCHGGTAGTGDTGDASADHPHITRHSGGPV